ncbi:MAG TPA: PIN domain nuclease [Deltaproteobacteria bacterium]|nr:PIN domain nuclease [Deltaproteobacteria bacterium]
MVILDTCALIELCLEEPGLKAQTLKRIQEGSEVLSVSFAEIALKLKKGALELNLTAKDLLDKFLEIPEVTIVDINVKCWLDAIDLEWHHKDPADRLIVAYAQSQKIPVVTSDKLIKKFYRNVLW